MSEMAMLRQLQNRSGLPVRRERALRVTSVCYVPADNNFGVLELFLIICDNSGVLLRMQIAA